MRRLALLLAGGALWLFIAAIPAFADGGPHIANTNNGTGGLTADTCAQCHRAHTAQGEDLLYTDPAGICLSCHNGGNATTNVNLGVQYVPVGATGQHTTSVVGALKGGGFQFALIGAGNRETYYSQGQYVKFTGFNLADTFTLTFEGQTTIPITYAGEGTKAQQDATKANMQAALVLLSNVGNTAGQAGLYAPQPNMTVSYDTTNLRFSVSLQNGLTTAKDVNGQQVLHSVMSGTVSTGTGSIATGRSSDPADRNMSHVGVLTSGAAVTSIHDAGTGVVWGNGPVSASVGYTLAAGQDLDCAKCHNPHGNGAYRILRSDPGEDWGTSANPFPNGSPVLVPDVNTDSTKPDYVNPVTTTRNYTVLPAPLGQANSATAVNAVFNNTQGDYWRYKMPAWNITNFSSDTSQAGWAQDTTRPNVTEWCISCHTRYNGKSTTLSDGSSSPSSLTSPDNDPHFTYRHGTERIGCLQCHVSHGSNVAMNGFYSQNYANPANTVQLGDSRLLKAPNRGTCQLCHDPTATKQGGDFVGPSPAPAAP